MKHMYQISSVAIFCVICTAVSGAYGASSVRSLGGAGTYTSASAASSGTATAGTTTTGRAGSVRVMPTASKTTAATVKPTATSSAGTTSARTAANNSRLSLGKYLANTTAVVKPAGSNQPSSSGNINIDNFVDIKDFNVLKQEVTEVSDDVKALSDKFNGSEYIVISDQGIGLDVERLAAELDIPEVSIYINDDNKLVWSDGETENVLDLTALKGLSSAEVDNAIQTWASGQSFATQSYVDDAIAGGVTLDNVHAGDNITIEKEGNVITISASADGGYDDTELSARVTANEEKVGELVTTVGGHTSEITSLKNDKMDKMTIDAKPTQDSGNLVTSGGVATAIAEAVNDSGSASMPDENGFYVLHVNNGAKEWVSVEFVNAQ